MPNKDEILPAKDWSALDDQPIEEQLQHQEDQRQQDLDHEQKLMYEMVRSNPAAIRHLREKFIETAIAAPGDDMLSIGMKQGQANMIKWIMNKAEQGIK